MKRILLPTDFSDNALHAIRYALELFKNDVCVFYIMHSYTPAIYQAEYVLHSPGQIGLGDPMQTHVDEQLQLIESQLIHEFENPKHSFVCHSAFNTLVGEVQEIIKNEHIDLVVMGTQGATGAREILFGSHTVHVIRKANCPVLAIPTNYNYVAPMNILFPTDYEIDFDKDHLRELLHIATNFQAMLHVLHMTSPNGLNELQQSNKEKLTLILSSLSSAFHDYPDQEVLKGIASFQIDQPVDILAMIKNKHTFFERLFIDPVIKKIGFHVKVPFLVLPSKHQNSKK